MLPQDCFLCGANAGATLLCDACRINLPLVSPASCPVCALPTPGINICGACQKLPPHFDASFCCFRYAFPVDRLIQALKFQHSLALSKFFADALLASYSTVIMRNDLLLALPLSGARLRERGFNQAMEIARPVAKQLGLPLLAEGYGRSMDAAPQSSLPWKERHRNIRGVFECGLELTGKSVIVVDDVMTTGSTLNEFARTLKIHGASRVTNLAVARAYRE